MLAIDPREFRAALRARDRAVAFHLFDPNVMLIDVGWQIKESQDRQITEKLAVRAHLRHKLRGPVFEVFATHNPERVITEQKIGFPVDIIEAHYPLEWYWYPPPPRARVYDPLRGGISISREWSLSYGTLGGIVEDRDTGDKMILSNWHVLVGSAYARKGLSIVQPGYADGGRSQHTIAHLERHTMNDGIDAAIAKLTDARAWINDQLGIGPVSGVTAPTLGIHVTKSGRSSEVTNGMITGIGGVRKIPYGGFERTVRHVIHIAQVSDGGQVSTGGDSGSWWLEEETHLVVGLHFAGSNVPEYGLAIAMPQVLDALNVDIVSTIEPVMPATPERRLEPVRV